MRTARSGRVALGCLVVAASSPLASALTPDAARAVEARIHASGADVALAFRMLDGSDELFVQPDTSFHAASTMKVPVMVELYARVHDGSLKLDDAVPVRNEFRSLADGSRYALEAADDSEPSLYARIGSTATLGELCDKMITASSNLATNLLIDVLGAGAIQRQVDALGARGIKVLRGVEDGPAYRAGLNNTTTARGLMLLMTSIARGDAVDAQASREMAAILKRQQFNEGIPAGLPAATDVAHKTGELPPGLRHDAAIVYAPRPFVLVVLVRQAADADTSARLIADLARLLYAASQPPPASQ